MTSLPQIIGGSLDYGDPAIVGIEATHEDGSVNICTGTLIAPRVVLTAAHCICTEVVGPNASFSVTTDDNLKDNDREGQWFAVSRAVWDDAYSYVNYRKGHDIGLLILESPMTLIKPIPINRSPLHEPDFPVGGRIVGYGRSNRENSLTSGLKRTAVTTTHGFDEEFVKHGTTAERTCVGDSGGPILIKRDGREMLFGVTSWAEPGCYGETRSTRVDRYLDFIDRYAQ